MRNNKLPDPNQEGLFYEQCAYRGKTTVICEGGRLREYEKTILKLWCNHGLIGQKIPHFILEVGDLGATPAKTLFTVWVPLLLAKEQVKQLDGNKIQFVQLYMLPPHYKDPVTFTFEFEGHVIGATAEEKKAGFLNWIREVMK